MRPMIIETFAVGPLGCNCTILGCESTREAIVVDPGGDAERIHDLLMRHGLSLKAIFHTHAHFDHVMGTGALKEATEALVLLHPEDRPLYENLPLQGQLFGFPVPEGPAVDRYVAHGDRLRWGEAEGEVLHTPGHTPGSVCLHVGSESVVFTGDTLFAGGIGRTDLWGGSYPALMRSIHERLLTLDDATVVVPGHGETSTIGAEKLTNPFLQ